MRLRKITPKKIYNKLSEISWKFVPNLRFIHNFCNKYNKRYLFWKMGNMKTNGELKVIKTFIPKSKVIFDVGANCGDWTKIALKENPNTIVHCFEPCSKAFNKLINENKNSKVTANKIAMSSKTGTSEIFIFDVCDSYNSINKRDIGYGIGKPNKTETVELETIDNYCEKNNIKKIDFLKIDTEGHELEVLKGAIEMLNKNLIDIIQFEYGDTYIDAGILLKDMFNFFKETQYDLYKVYLNEIIPINKYNHDLETFEYQNWLAINKSLNLLTRI